MVSGELSTFPQCRTPVHASIASIQMLCEGHNSRAQDYLRNQDELSLGRKAKKKINLVSEVVHFFREASRVDVAYSTYDSLLTAYY